VKRTTWRSVADHRALAVLLCAALPVEIAAAANLVLRVGSVDSAGGGALGVGGAFAAMSLAFAVAVIPAGILVDRTPARRTFAIALAIRALPMLIGGVLALGGALTTATVIALAAGDGLAMALLRPSWQHFQASLLPDEAARDAAVLDDWIARAGALFGALAGGVAVLLGHTGAGLLVCAAGFLPLLAALGLGLGAGLPRPIPASGIDSLRSGWSALRVAPRLAQATRAEVVLSLALPVGVLAPAVTVALSAVQHLWLIALAAGAGALAGTTWVTLCWHRMGPARMLRAAAVVLVGVLAVEAVALNSLTMAPTAVWLAGACVAVAAAEAAMTAMFAVTGSVVQAEAPPAVRGSVTGIVQAPRHIAAFLSASAVGMAISWAGPALTIGVLAAAAVAAVAWLRGFSGVECSGSQQSQAVGTTKGLRRKLSACNNRPAPSRQVGVLSATGSARACRSSPAVRAPALLRSRWVWRWPDPTRQALPLPIAAAPITPPCRRLRTSRQVLAAGRGRSQRRAGRAAGRALRRRPRPPRRVRRVARPGHQRHPPRPLPQRGCRRHHSPPPSRPWK